MLLHDATTGVTTGVNSSGVAASGCHRRTLPQAGLPHHAVGRSTCGPPCPAKWRAWEVIHQRFLHPSLGSATRPRHRLRGRWLSPSRRGIGRSLGQQCGQARPISLYGSRIPAARVAPLVEGDLLVNADLARSLRVVAEGGADAFYRGATGAPDGRRSQCGRRACLAKRILTNTRPRSTNRFRPPTATIPSTRPVRPSQGFLLLEMLNLIEGFDIASLSPHSPEAIHLMVEAKKNCLC